MSLALSETPGEIFWFIRILSRGGQGGGGASRRAHFLNMDLFLNTFIFDRGRYLWYLRNHTFTIQTSVEQEMFNLV